PPPFTPPTPSLDTGFGVQAATVLFPVGTTTQDQFGLYRPILPLQSQEVTTSAGPARGVWITALATTDTAVTPTLGMPTIDLAAHEPKPHIHPIFFPASPFMLEHSIVFGKQRDYVNVSDQFRPNAPPSVTGTQRHVTSATFKVLYSNSVDVIPPLLSQVTVSPLASGSVTVLARITDDSG